MILAGFKDEAAMDRAATNLASVPGVQTHSPAPPEHDEGSVLPLIVLAAGVLGAAAAFAVQAYAAVSYPIDTGGRPLVFWPAFIPAAFETGVLAAVAAGFLSFLILCRLPALYEPLDESEAFRRASRDLWFLVVPGEQEEQARPLLIASQPVLMDEVPG